MATLDEYITAHDDTATTPEADAPDWAVIGERVAAGDARCIVILADAAGGTATTARGFTITEMNVALVASALRLAEHAHQLFTGEAIVAGHFTDEFSHLRRAFVIACSRLLH